MKFSILTYPLTISFLLSSGITLGQVKKDTPPTNDKKTKVEQPKAAINEEIEVLRPYKPILTDAVKIRINPDLKNNPTFKPRLIYTILDKTLSLDSNIAKLQAQKLPVEKSPVFTNNYLKAGIGNLNTTLAELYLNNGKDEALQIGLAVKHLAQQGNLAKQQFSHQDAILFGRHIGSKITFSGQFKYDRLSTYFYGFNPILGSNTLDPAKQQLELLEVKGDLLNNFKENGHFSYKLNANSYLFRNIFEARENNLLAATSLNLAIKKFNIGIGAALDLTNSKDVSYSIDNHIFKAYPYVKIKGNQALLDFGFNIVQEYGTQQKLHIFPTASISFPIAVDYVNFFGGVNGDVIKTNLKDLATANPYLNQNVTITNSIEKLTIYGGIKGNAGHALGFKATAFYKQIENMQLFQNNTSQINRFDVIYDDGQSEILGIEGEVDIKASKIFSLISKIEANNYSMATEQQAWLKPSLRITATGYAKLSAKLSFNAEIVRNDKMYAKLNDGSSNTQTIAIDAFTDLNLGTEYAINPKARIYLQATNILGTSYQEYLYYPKLGFGIFGGLNFSF